MSHQPSGPLATGSQVDPGVARHQEHVPWNLDAGRRRGELGYLPGLDGIRAIAIIGVLLYHADIDWMPGGFLGVDVFFVLSGFLITSLILEEFDRSGGVDFKRFYLRRARRLLPAVALLLLVVAGGAAFVYKDAAQRVLSDGIASMLYVANWRFIAADVSYFEALGRPPMFAHLWSLSVEEQFYFIWPAIAFFVMRRWRRRGVAAVALLGALTSTTWMLVMSAQQGFPELADPSRAYFGTDTHAMGLLVGATLATFWRPGRIHAPIPRAAATITNAVGIAALIGVIWFYAFVGEYTPWMYDGGFLVLALVVAVLIAAASHPGAALGAWLGRQPLRYIGERSYGLYLWHWPVFVVTRPGVDIGLDGLPLFVLRIAIVFAIAELSYRFVEMPIRRGAITRFVAKRRAATGAVRTALTRRALAVGVLVLAVAVSLGGILASTAATHDALADDVKEAIGIASGGPTAVSIDADAATEPASSPASTLDPLRNGPMSVIGDSVMLGARSAVKTAVPGARVDAEVARMPGAFIGRIKKLKANDKLAPIIVLHPATNGVLPESMMRDMLDLLTGYDKVVVVNSQMPRTWRAPNNAVIDTVVPDYPNAVIADWYSASSDRPEYFASDGVHLTPVGAAVFADLIKQTAGL